MSRTADNYPVIPHESAGAEDCCGCLVPKVEGDQVRLVCNECGAVTATITTEQFKAGYVPEKLRSEELTTAQCPRCGAMNTFPGFSSIDAFICSECGEGVSIERPIQ
jgi:hypothetical protein